MTNPFYNPTGTPVTGSFGASANIRAEFDAIETAFEKLPSVLTANKAVVINSGGTGMTLTTGSLALAGNFTTTGAYNTTLVQQASVSITLPTTSAVMARTDAAQTFTGTQTFGALLATTVNGNTITTGTGVLTLGAGKTLTASNTLTFTGTDGSSVNFGTGGTVLYSGGSYVSSITGTANEITASASTGAVTLSLPSALTFTGKTVTGGTFASPTLSGTVAGSPTFSGTLSVNKMNITGDSVSQPFTVTGPSSVASSIATFTAASGNPRYLNITNTGSAQMILSMSANSGADTFGITVGAGTTAVGTNGPMSVGAGTALTISGPGGITFSHATTMSAALTYGGVTLSNSVTGTGSMVLSASPTFTGTVTAATVTASAIVTLTSANGEPLRVNGATTGQNALSLTNTGGSAYFGQENSTGNNLIAGSTAYDTIIRGPSGIAFSANAGSNLHMRLSSTGALTVSSTLTANAGVKQGSNGSSANSGFQGLSSGSTVLNVRAYDATSTALAVFERSDATVSSSLYYDGSGVIWFGTTTAHPFDLYSNNARVARCGTDGSFLVGTTTNSGWAGNAKAEILQATNSTVALSAYASGTTAEALRLRVDSTGTLFAGFRYSTGEVGSITTNGTTTAYNTTSDESLKNFDVAQRDFGAMIDAIMVKDAVYKAQPTLDNRVLSISAQQTAACGYWDAITPANPNDEKALWQADYGRLAPLALWGVKDLRARVAELESTVTNLSKRLHELEAA